MRFTAIRMVKRRIRVEDIAFSMRLNRSTVFGWMKRFRQSGLESLRSTKAPGARPKLKAPQFLKLIRTLHEPATRWGFWSDLWTGPRVRNLIKKLFGITLHPTHMPRFLRRLGLVRRIPEPRALEQDPRAVRLWKKKILPKILRSCARAKGILLYGDESVFVLIPHIGKTWTFPGSKPIIRVSGQRGVRVGVTSAVSQKGHLFFQFSKSNFNSGAFIRFMKALHRHFPSRKIFFIVDGAPGHRSQAVREFSRKNAQWLALHYLPSYSPELNPSEEVWNTTKAQKLSARPLPDRQHLKKAVLGSLRSLQKQPHRVQKFFKE